MAQAAPSPFPVTIRGTLTESLNRWLFLVKWLLIIPHLVLLIFLFIVFVVSWLIAFFAVLFTGRYPRGLFDFNVGVLRWSWRVSFYSYEALGTDRYPPFSLTKKDDYPADLDVIYPEKLSRWQVLVKWWLLAIPHYIVLDILADLLTVLVLVAAVVNLFTGKYPKGIWDLVLGINWWTYRVAGYATLVTDNYPPFRFGE